jgi:hypothetical protein
MAAAPTNTKTAPSAPGSGQSQNGGTAAAQQTPSPAQSVVPFLRGSGKGKYKFYSKSGLSLTTATQDLGPIDVKAFDFMRSILVTVTTTADGGITSGSVANDGPFNIFTNIAVKQPNGQTMYSVSSGYNAAMIQKYGIVRRNADPRAVPEYTFKGATGTATEANFSLRIPFELDLRDALGALPNKDAAAPFSLELTLNTLANVWPTGSPTTPTLKVEAWLEAYDQPPTVLNGSAVQTSPPNMNTLQRWTEQNVTMSTGEFDARVRKLGNYIRCLIPILKTTSARTDSDWADPVQIVLDEDVKDNRSQDDWKRGVWETYGYGAAGSTVDTAAGRDTGVYPIQYFLDGRSIDENANLYLPTIESEDYLLRGSWGSNASKMTVLVGEVLPQGDIFGG